MNLLLLGTDSTGDAIGTLSERLTAMGHDVRTETVPIGSIETDWPDNHHDSDAYQNVDYTRAEQWRVEPAWIDAMMRLAPGVDYSVDTRARCFYEIGSTSGPARRHFAWADAVIAFDLACLATMLHWSKPWIMIGLQRPASGDRTERALHWLGSRLCPHLVTVAKGRWRAIKRAGEHTHARHAGQLSQCVAEAITELDRPGSPSRKRHEAMLQKRFELRYEAASVDVYDDVYHRGIIYRKMDERLSSLIVESKPQPSVRLLDLGCGPGSLLPALRAIPGLDYVGVDLVPSMIERARELYPDARFLVGDMEALADDDNTYDVVLCSGVLHHLPDTGPALAEIRRVLKPGGLLVAREPNELHFASLFPSLAFAHICLKHLLGATRDRPQYSEPEAHDFHRNYTMRLLVDHVKPWMRVERLVSDLRVSYFYDVFEEDDDYPIIAALENTIEHLPGLNVVVVARKADAGISDTAESALSAFEEATPPGHEHFETFLDLIDRSSGLDGADRLPADILDRGVPGVLEHLDLESVHVVTNDPSDPALERLSLTNHGRIAFQYVHTDRLDQLAEGGLDAVVVCLDWQAESETLRAVAERVRDYGHVFILPGGGSVVPPENGVAFLAQLLSGKIIGMRNEIQTGGPFTLVRRTTYSLLDVCQALLNGLEVAPETPEFAAVRERTESKIRALVEHGATAFYEYIPSVPAPEDQPAIPPAPTGPESA